MASLPTPPVDVDTGNTVSTTPPDVLGGTIPPVPEIPGDGSSPTLSPGETVPGNLDAITIPPAGGATLSPNTISPNFALPPGQEADTDQTWPPDPEAVTAWLVEPREYLALCPNGFVCDGLFQSNCTKIRIVSLSYGFGDVHGGGFCPEGESQLLVCPVGHYCPTAEELVECPAGFFCPYKSNRPYIECQGCEAGSETLVRELYGYIYIAILFAILLGWAVMLGVQKYQQDLYSRLLDLTERSLDSAKSVIHRKERAAELERLRPKLFAIYQRLEQLDDPEKREDCTADLSGSAPERCPSNSTAIPESVGDINAIQTASQSSKIQHSSSNTVALSFAHSGKIKYQAARLFDTLDKNADGQLDFEELQLVLELNHFQLDEFVRRMNELGGEPTDTKAVTRRCFVNHFLEVLEETSHFGPTPSEVEALFDELATGKGSSDLAAFQDFFDSRLSIFLSDPQINDLITRFRRVEQGGASSTRIFSTRIANPHHSNSRRSFYFGQFASRRRPSAGSEIGDDSGGQVLRNTGSPSRFSIGRLDMTGVQGHHRKRFVSKSTFVAHYAQLLAEVTQDPDPTPIESEHMTSISTDELLGVDLAFDNLSLAVSVGDKHVNVVNQVSGRLKAQTMTALMGGSGAGKTSLLNALCGRAFYGETTGTIRINGHIASIEDHKGATGFVPQDDIVHAELTVKENLMYSGRFTLHKRTSMDDIEDLANSVLANLGLSRVANSIVGDVNRRGVSGGEKKRVNIGVELMSRPSILFLDEPTSGLDSSSALLVMGSLKNLVERQGVTILSVIHQPRKTIFDSFDSLILLGVGGNMVYHGPVTQAQSYFANMPRPYLLPAGESLADWLIDVSSGRLAPSESTTPKDRDDDDGNLRRRPQPQGGSNPVAAAEEEKDGYEIDTKSTFFPGDNGGAVVGTQGPSTVKFEQTLEVAKERRQILYDCWNGYFKSLSESERQVYLPPAPYALPRSCEKPSFWTQFKGQIQRMLLISWRNRGSKLVDTTMIVGAVVLIAWLQGITEVTRAQQPNLSFQQLIEGDPYLIAETFPRLFIYALGEISTSVEFALKISVITSVLLGLTAAKTFTSKRLEFFRESGSGWNINAYFLSLNILSTVEHSAQMILAAGCAYWIRDSLTTWYSYQVQFLMLMWSTVSWSLLIPLLVPATNTVLAVGFFMAFFGLLFSGGIDPVTYKDIYEIGNSGMAFFSGTISVTRYFIESMTVQEQRCLPAQSGFTVLPTSVNFPVDIVGSFHLVGLAQNDLSVVQQSCDGWYWGVWPALMVGLSLRVLAAGVLHIYDRPKQCKKSLWHDLSKRPLSKNRTIRTLCLFSVFVLGMFGVSAFLILTQTGDTSIQDPPQDNQSLALLADETIQGIYPNAQPGELPPGFQGFVNETNTTASDQTGSS